MKLNILSNIKSLTFSAFEAPLAPFQRLGRCRKDVVKNL